MKKFVIRLSLFLLFALIGPCVYLIVKFDLFKTTSKLQVGIWGIVVISMLLGVVGVLIKYYIEGMKAKYSLLKQILLGVIKLILPLVLCLVVITWLDDNINLIKEFLYILIPCELVAIVINPLPKWCFENNVEGIGEIADKILHKEGGSE